MEEQGNEDYTQTMSRQLALERFTQDIIDGEPYGDSPEAFEQWLEDNHIEVSDLASERLADSEGLTNPPKSGSPISRKTDEAK